MPITISPFYRTYARLLAEDRLSLEGATCPRPEVSIADTGDTLVLTRVLVERDVVLLEVDDYGEWRTVLEHGKFALARCPVCKRRFRVLPSDVLPRKRYSIEVIEHLLTEYGRGELGLRRVTDELLGDRMPAHTTLHAWSEGLGAHALGLTDGEVEGGSPVSRLLAETESRVQAIGRLLTHDYAVDPRRYRSDERRERLSANRRILAIARLATGLSSPFAFARWRQLALRWSTTCALLFRTGISCTAIERGASTGSRGSRAPRTESLDRCRTPTRSPPGASNRSPHSSIPPSTAPS